MSKLRRKSKQLSSPSPSTLAFVSGQIEGHEADSPSEKKSVAGVGKTGRGAAAGFGRSSSDIFFLPFNDVGTKAIDGVESTGSTDSGTSSGTLGAELATGSCDTGALLKTSPGPFPPPKTRCAGAGVGTACLGVGSIDISNEDPAPVFLFFAGGSSEDATGLWSSFSAGPSEGSVMAIFFGFVVLVVTGFVALGFGDGGGLESLSLPYSRPSIVERFGQEDGVLCNKTVMVMV